MSGSWRKQWAPHCDLGEFPIGSSNIYSNAMQLFLMRVNSKSDII